MWTNDIESIIYTRIKIALKEKLKTKYKDLSFTKVFLSAKRDFRPRSILVISYFCRNNPVFNCPLNHHVIPVQNGFPNFCRKRVNVPGQHPVRVHRSQSPHSSAFRLRRESSSLDLPQPSAILCLSAATHSRSASRCMY